MHSRCLKSSSLRRFRRGTVLSWDQSFVKANPTYKVCPELPTSAGSKPVKTWPNKPKIKMPIVQNLYSSQNRAHHDLNSINYEHNRKIHRPCEWDLPLLAVTRCPPKMKLLKTCPNRPKNKNPIVSHSTVPIFSSESSNARFGVNKL